MTKSLGGRLGVALSSTALASVLITGLITVGLVRNFVAEDTVRELELQARSIVSQSDLIGRREAQVLATTLQASGNMYAILRPDGSVETADDLMVRLVEVAGIEHVPGPLPARRMRPPPTEAREAGTASVEGDPYAYVALQRGRGPTIVLARPAGLERDTWVPVALRTLLAALIAVGVAIVASTLIARRLARPIGELAVAADRISKGDLSHRVPEEGTDELGRLARSFNSMASSLGESRRREREFLASVSHELKTPLTVIRGYAEAIRDGKLKGRKTVEAGEVIELEADRLAKMVGDVMDLARLGAGGLSIDLTETDVAKVLRDAAAAHSGDLSPVEVICESPLMAMTDPARLRQIVDNLIANAVRVSPSGAPVQLTAHAQPGEVIVRVSDGGPGIAKDDLPHVFERSYLWNRYRGERNVGTGFGLAIVRDLALAMGAKVEVSSEPGAGTTFTLALPGA